MFGPQEGTGKLLGVETPPPTAWCLGSVREWEDETVAAAAPAKNKVKARMRSASCIIGNPFVDLN